MFDIGWSELLIIAIVLIVVVGPKDLPPMLRAFGKMTQRAKRVASDFRAQFDEALREADMDELRETLHDAQRLNPAHTLREAMNPLRQMGNDLKADLQKATRLDPQSEKLEETVSDNEFSKQDTISPSVTGIESPVEALGASPMANQTSSEKAAVSIPSASATPLPDHPQPVEKPIRKSRARTVSVAGGADVTAEPRRSRSSKATIGETAIDALADKPKRAPRKNIGEAAIKAGSTVRKSRAVKSDNGDMSIKKDDA